MKCGIQQEHAKIWREEVSKIIVVKEHDSIQGFYKGMLKRHKLIFVRKMEELLKHAKRTDVNLIICDNEEIEDKLYKRMHKAPYSKSVLLHNTPVLAIDGYSSVDMMGKKVTMTEMLSKIRVMTPTLLSKEIIDVFEMKNGIEIENVSQTVAYKGKHSEKLTARELAILIATLNSDGKINNKVLTQAVFGHQRIENLRPHLTGLKKKLAPLGVEVVSDKKGNVLVKWNNG
jgi:hypothetical protein